MYHNLADYQSDEVEIDFLFPNGFFYTSQVSRNCSIHEIKKKLKALYKNLKNDFYFKLSESYYFSAITTDAQQIELHNDNVKLSELNLINWTLKLNETDKDSSEKIDNTELDYLIGISLEDLDETKDIELIEYRIELLSFVRNLIENELNMNSNLLQWEIFTSSFSQNVEINTDNLVFSPDKSLIEDECLVYLEIAIHDIIDGSFIVLNASVNQKPTDLIREYFKIKLNDIVDRDQISDMINDYEKSYILIVCGTNDVIYGNRSLGEFKYIKKCLWQKKVPSLYLKEYEKFSKNLKKPDFYCLNFIKRVIDNLNKRHILLEKKLLDDKFVLSIFNSDNLRILIDFAALIPELLDCDKIFFKTSIFANGSPVARIFESEKYDLTMINQEIKLPIQFNKQIDYEIKIKSLPSCSKFCFCLFSLSKKKKIITAFAFVSINLFDYKGFLINGKQKFSMWSLESLDSFENICLNHYTGSNPDKNSSYLRVKFLQQEKFKFPNIDQIQSYCFDHPKDVSFDNFVNNFHNFQSVINKNCLNEISTLEKKILWQNRSKCSEFPHSIIKLIKCVDWTNHLNVLEYYKLLEKWPFLKPLDAFLLLNCDVTDIKTRSFAVQCLDVHMKNEEVEFFMLQIVQALKNEPYLNNDLSKFILKRAFESSKIGYKLFWILKTEISDPKYKNQFQVILEAFCRKKGPYYEKLIKQVETIDTLTHLSKCVRNTPASYFNLIKKNYLKEKIDDSANKKVLSNLVNPIDETVILGTICPRNCFILSSAKRPLYLTWKNEAPYSHFFESYFQMIFKNGDDLRQDHLTIQAFRLMDIIWKNENLDLKMLIYDTMPTGNKLGFIEIIKESLTVFEILTESGAKGRYQIDDFQLFKWISEQNQNEKLNIAIDNFTKSCAAFCVATFLLGIGDRHPSNIMISKEGKLFHIDFGHFLGHFKEKFGFKRERVPFVLTEHFTKVISKGAINPTQTAEFQRFRSLCESAYLIIRRHSNLFINMFTVMLSSGIPELKSKEDIMYLKNKLATDMNEEKALSFFREQFDESLMLSFTTRFDWIFHALNHRN